VPPRPADGEVGASAATVPLVTRHGYVDAPWGEIHYARCGQGQPVLLLHQSPRSWNEFRDVLPILGAQFDVVAPDTVGFGSSAFRPGVVETIDVYADGVVHLIEQLALPTAALVGHHTGALVALETAARIPERVGALVLSSAPFKTPEERQAALAGPGIDEVAEQADGMHLAELWRRRQSFYPDQRPDLLRRFVADALRVGDRIEEGHRAVNRYPVEDRVGFVTCPVLVMAGTADPFAHPMLQRWREVLLEARFTEIVGGMVPLPDQLPEEFAAAVAEFVTSVMK
jgi:pimeloyl-ACP methyl ester carboxylesterase